MFSRPRVNVIESTDGYSVEVRGRTGLIYTEGSRTMFIDSEVLAPSSAAGLVMYANTIRHWEPPHSAESIDESTKARIVENVKAAFQFQGLEIELEG